MAIRHMPDAPQPEPVGTSRLHVVVAAPVGIERVVEVLGRARRSWLGDPVARLEGADGGTRHLIDLELRVIDRGPRITFRKAAHVELGALRSTSDGAVEADITWRAAGMTPLFPVFAGAVRWDDGQLVLSGVYAPPGGGVGAMADRLLLNVAARGTARRLLERLAEVLSEGVRL